MYRFFIPLFSLFVLAFSLGNSHSAYAIGVRNLALHQPTFASSAEEMNNRGASSATDNDTTSRWASQFNSDKEWIYVDLGSVISFDRVKLNWEDAYATNYEIQISNNATDWTSIRTVTNNAEHINDFSFLKAQARYVRVYCTARRLQNYGYSIYEFSVYNISNLAYRKPATASSTNNSQKPKFAFDDNEQSRWESIQGQDPSWIYVDLGQSYTIGEIKLTWEAALGKDFLVQVSDDASNWTTVKTVTGNTELVNDYVGLSVQGRYVRMYGTARGTDYGYSLFEFGVYGPDGSSPLPVTLTSFTAKAGKIGVQLGWTTASEKDNQGFELQRSVAGAAFERVTYQRGAGTSTTSRTYQYLDTNAPAGLVYYRLLQTDTDGTTTYSPVAATQVAYHESVAAVTYSVYPNPTTEEAHVAWTTAAPTAVVLQVRDNQGNTVVQRTLTEEYGQNSIVLDLRAYPTGLYFLALRNATGLVYQTKMVKR